jgi:hypothetical protein
VGDANRPLAARGAPAEPAVAGATLRNGKHAAAAAEESVSGSGGGGAILNGATRSGGEVSHSGRPDQLVCRLVIDCMVGGVYFH